MSCAITAEPIEMPFGSGQSRVSPRNHILHTDPKPPREAALLTGYKDYMPTIIIIQIQKIQNEFITRRLVQAKKSESEAQTYLYP